MPNVLKLVIIGQLSQCEGPTANACPLRKTCSKRAFPLPRAHMHTHAASERADTHMRLTRKQARHLPDILCGLTRARDHRSARVAARKQASHNCEVATAACTTARTEGHTLPATAPKYAGMAMRTLRYLPGPCTQGARAGAHLTVSPRASVEGARRVLATPEGARRGGPPPAWSSLMGLLRPHLAVAPAPGAPTMHGAITHDPSSRHPELFVSIPDSAKKNHFASPKRVASSVKGCVATRFQFRVACRDTKKSTPRNFRYLVNSEL